MALTAGPISSANELSLKYKEDWLRYELALAVKLNKIQEVGEKMKPEPILTSFV